MALGNKRPQHHMTTYTSHFINGAWQQATNPAVFEVHDASTEEVMATVPQGTAEEAAQAVLAARAAFPAWSALSVEERCVYIDKIVAGLKARTDEMATAIAREVGMPIKLAKMVQVGGPVFNWGNAAKVARAYPYEEKVGHSLVVREPIGVVGCITPWNFPLNQITLKIAPALASGCTVVLKPSEIAPVNAMLLAEIIHDAGLPAGVFNLVNGLGPVVGEVLASHPEVDMVSFTGSTRAGKRVAELAADTVKRVALELGGKSASIILPDADFEAAVKGSISACLLNSGQTCSAHLRSSSSSNSSRSSRAGNSRAPAASPGGRCRRRSGSRFFGTWWFTLGPLCPGSSATRPWPSPAGPGSSKPKPPCGAARRRTARRCGAWQPTRVTRRRRSITFDKCFRTPTPAATSVARWSPARCG